MQIKPAQSSNFAVALLYLLSDMFGRRMVAVDASQRYGSCASKGDDLRTKKKHNIYKYIYIYIYICML